MTKSMTRKKKNPLTMRVSRVARGGLEPIIENAQTRSLTGIEGSQLLCLWAFFRKIKCRIYAGFGTHTKKV